MNQVKFKIPGQSEDHAQTSFNLSEMNPDKKITALIYGEAGAGKSVAAATFPGPILWFDWDRKISSVASHFRGNDLLKNIQVWQPSPGIEHDSMPEFFEETQKLDDLVASGGKLPETIVLDTLTTFSNAMLRHIVRTNPNFKRPEAKQKGASTCQQDYGILKKVFVQMFSGILTLPCNIILLGHIKTEKDDSTGEILRQTNMDGSFAKELPSLMEEVYRIHVKDGKRLIQTVADNRYFARTQRKVPNDCDITNGLYEEIIKQR